MRNSSIADRDPCPYRIIEDIGGAFAFGAIGGGIWHLGKGAFQSPKGARLSGALGNCAARAPVMGGQFAVWGGLFACCDCSLSAIRQKVCVCVGVCVSSVSACRLKYLLIVCCRFHYRPTTHHTGRPLELHHVRRCHGRDTRGEGRAEGHGVGGGRRGGHTGADRGHGNMDEQLLQHAAAGDGG